MVFPAAIGYPSWLALPQKEYFVWADTVKVRSRFFWITAALFVELSADAMMRSLC